MLGVCCVCGAVYATLAEYDEHASTCGRVERVVVEPAPREPLTITPRGGWHRR